MKQKFERDSYRQAFQKMSSWSQEDIEQVLDRMEHQQRNLKAGNNVVSLQYYSRFLPDEDVEKLEKDLQTHNLELSYVDETMTPKASVVDYLVALYVTTSVCDEIIKNVIWDGIVFAFSKSLGLFRRNPPGHGNFVAGLTFEIDTGNAKKMRKLKFHVSPDTDPEIVNKALRYIPEIVRAVSIESFKKDQESRYVEDTLTLTGEGKFSINTFLSPEIAERSGEKAKSPKKRNMSRKRKKK